MDTDELFALIEGAPGRFRSIRLTAQFWVDRDLQFDALERYGSNPGIVASHLGIRRDRWPTGREEQRWKVWAQFPSRVREEWTNRDAHAHVYVDDGSAQVWDAPFLVRTGMPPMRQPMPEEQRWARTLSRVGNHVLGELLVPEEFLGVAIFDDEGSPPPTMEVLGRGTHAERDVIKTRLIVDWNRGGPLGDENLAVADDYEGLVDAETGVVLRWACRLDGNEFWVVSIDEVAFDEPLDADLFKAPIAEDGGTRQS